MAQQRLIPREISGQVPFFKVRRLNNGLVKATCQRCGGWVVVDPNKWLRSVPDYATRACTHCFKVSYIRHPMMRRPEHE